MADVTIQIIVRDDAGNQSVANATLPLTQPPVIEAVFFNPPTIGLQGGDVVVTVTAFSPSGRPLSYSAVPSVGSVEAGPQANQFIWHVPAQ